MDEDFLREVASQLRKPSGDFGLEVAENMNVSNRHMNLDAINALQLTKNDTVLEVGMANGAFASTIVHSAPGISYLGIDYSLDMVNNAIRLNGVLSDKCSFEVSDASTLPFDANSIDKVLTVNTIYFWDSVIEVFKELNRVLKENGFLVIGLRPEGCLKKYPSTKYNFEFYTQLEVEQFLIECGFEVFHSSHHFEDEIEILNQKIIPEYVIVGGKKISTST